MGKTIRNGGKSGVLVTVGFSDLLEKINKAQGDVEAAAWEAARTGAKELYDEIKSEATASGVPDNLTAWPNLSMQSERDSSGNRYGCKVGWKVGEYDPKNPSAAHKVIFMNYGTPRRFVRKEGQRIQIDGKWVTVDVDRGYVDGRGFIGRAKKKAMPKVKKAQEEALKKMLEELT